MPDEIRQSIRVWDMEEYVTVPTWAERLSRRQLVILKKNEKQTLDHENDASLQRLLKKRRELTMPNRDIRRQGKHPRWFRRMKFAYLRRA